jgi:hypothetical protein
LWFIQLLRCQLVSLLSLCVIVLLHGWLLLHPIKCPMPALHLQQCVFCWLHQALLCTQQTVELSEAAQQAANDASKAHRNDAIAAHPAVQPDRVLNQLWLSAQRLLHQSTGRTCELLAY